MEAELKFFGFNALITNIEEADLLCKNQEFFIPLMLSIGIKGKEGADYFYLDVYNTEWLRRRSEYKWGNALLIMDSDNIYDIKDVIEDKIKSIEGKDWDEIVSKLTRYFSWEYDDIKVS